MESMLKIYLAFIMAKKNVTFRIGLLPTGRKILIHYSFIWTADVYLKGGRMQLKSKENSGKKQRELLLVLLNASL